MFTTRGYNKVESIKKGITFFLGLAVLHTSSIAKAENDAFGAAALLSSATPMVTSAIQASTDVQISRLNATTALTTAQIQSNNSKYLADSQERSSFFQSMLAMYMNKDNNKFQTERLMATLREQAENRMMQYGLLAQKRRDEHEYNLKRIAIAEKQAEDSLKLEKLKFMAAQVQAGLSNGLTDVTGKLTSIPTTQVIGSTTSSSASGTSSSLYGVVSPARKRMIASLGGQRLASVSSRLSPFTSLSQGSTRGLRQKGNSDLVNFQASIEGSPRAVLTGAFTRHAPGVQASETHSRGGISRAISAFNE